MTPPREGPFLARASYRRRRLMDAARLLPILGAALFWMPVLWTGGAEGNASTAGGGLYLFAVWTGLILAAGLVSRRLARTDPEAPAPRAP